MPWRYIDTYIERLSRHTTIYGKYWLFFVTIFRLTVLPFAETCWSDEQKEFKCNTQEPGCNNVCFNIFAPVNQVRLWSMQLLAITAPLSIYFVFLFHMCDKRKEKERRDKEIMDEMENDDVLLKYPPQLRQRLIPSQIQWGCPAHEKLNKQIIMPDLLNEVRESENTEKLIWRCYIIMVFLRSVIDAIFVYLQWTIYPYKTVVPLIFECTRWPCPHTVECWPSRVKEKTIFYHYMYIAAAITALLNICEIIYIGPRRILNAFTCVKATSDMMKPAWGNQSGNNTPRRESYHTNGSNNQHKVPTESTMSQTPSPVLKMPPKKFYDYPDRYYEHRPSLFQEKTALPNLAVNPNPHKDLVAPRPAEMADRMERRRRGSLFETSMDRADLQINKNNNSGEHQQYTIKAGVILGPVPRTAI